MRRAIAAIVIAVAAASCAAAATGSTAQSPSAPAATAELGERQEVDAGMVTIAASWISGTASALVAMDTHVVALDGFDLTKLARARLDGGAWVSPTQWDAPPDEHHRTGTLTFGSIDPKALAAARIIELEVRDVGAPSHLLRWERTR